MVASKKSQMKSAIANVRSSSNPPDSNPSSLVKERILSALRQKSPQRLIKAFIAAVKDEPLIKSIPRSTFREIFNILDPAHFVAPYRAIHYDFAPSQARKRQVRSLEAIFEDFRRVLRDVSVIRRTAGVPFEVGDYTYLLKCACIMGNGDAARVIWRDMKEDRVIPNTECYNHYLGAISWSGAFDTHRLKLRILPFYMSMRSSPTPVKGFDKLKAGLGGVREEALSIFDDMVQHGGVGDEQTFAFMITAMAREGDMEGVQGILKRLWNVNVEGLRERNEEEMESVKHYPVGSSLRPSATMLFAVAHAYGTNNDIPTALMLVDFISRHYQLTIPPTIWEHLFEWSFVLATPRHGERRMDGTTTGQLPVASIRKLWDTMTAEPYNLKVSMPILNRYIKNLWHRGMLEEYKRIVEEGHQRYRESAREHLLAQRRYLLAQSLASKGRLPALAEFDLDHIKQRLELAQLVKVRDFSYMQRWLRLLVSGRRWVAGPNREWERRGLPDIIDSYREFTSSEIQYTIRGSGRLALREEPMEPFP
ncbi:MAG: hypothetical protein M1837_003317 [Sclerophora amabilis]|nr:MAG: hypothetical protein M1837_003317 [Sclerophora amabilis]